MVTNDIIDFERINELTITKDDGTYNGISGTTISKKIIRDMMDVFTENRPPKSTKQLEYIRDKKIESIIENEK